jgi:serine phosphatase RsbU (regulator of sigma subunit)
MDMTVKLPSGLVLGIIPELTDFDVSVRVVPGSWLLVMSDGLTGTRA